MTTTHEKPPGAQSSDSQPQDDLTRARLAAIVTSSGDAIIGETLDGIITDWNPAAERLYGYTAEEAIGRHLSILEPPNRVREIDALLARVRNGESVGPFDTVRRTKDGRSIDIAISIFPVRDAGGQIIAACGIARDISARKAIERALAASEARYRALVEQVPAIIYTEEDDAAGTLSYISPYIETLLGYSPEECLVDRSLWMERIHPDDQEKIIAADERAAAWALSGERDTSSAPFAEEYRLTARDGRAVWVSGAATLIRDLGGKPLFWQGVALDITARKETEAALRASEARLAQAQEIAQLGSWEWDIAADRVVWSDQLFRIFGLEPGTVAGSYQGFLDRVHPDDRDRVNATIERAFASGEPFTFEHRIIVPDGGVRILHARGEVVPGDDGRPAGMRGTGQDITERVRAEAALRQSEERFRNAFEHAAIGMALVGLDGRFLQVNAALCALTGYPEPELLAKTFQDITHPEDLAADLAYVRRLLAGEIRAYDMEKRYVRKDGQIAWIRLSVALVRGERGAPAHFISQMEDITERKNVEAALADERELLNAVLEVMPDAVYVKDVDSRFLRLNPAAARTLGLTDAEEAIGKTDFDFFPASLARQYFADERQVITSGEPLLNRLEPQSEDAETAAWWLTSTVPLRDATGAIVGIVGSGRDITERLRTEAALRASEARQRALLTALPDIVFRLDRSGTYLDYKADRLADLVAPPEEFLGRNVGEVLPAALSQQVLTAIARVLDSGSPETLEYALELVAGHRDFEARLVASGPDEVVAVIRDVTERKRADQDVRAALNAAEAGMRAKNLFLGMMSHELRTPLQAILGYADFLLSDPTGSLTAEQAEDVGYIRSGAVRMVALIDQMLDLSRMEAGRLELDIEPVALTEIIERVRQDVAPQVAAKGLTLSIDVPPSLPPALADAERLRQILLNLVGNAVKFTETGSVDIGASTTADGIAVTIRDTGIGIAPRALTEIFEEFRQVDSSISRRYGGAGLGLAIARGLAQQMGGDIVVTSQPGSGSTFTLRLPAGRRSPRRQGAGKPASRSAGA